MHAWPSVVDHAGRLVANISIGDLRYVVEQNLDFLFHSVEHFLECMPRRTLVTCSPTASLMEVTEELAEAGVYRIYVVTEAMEPIAVITLTDVTNAVLLLAAHEEGEGATDPSAK
jgi:CBS domain-containing protein